MHAPAAKKNRPARRRGGKFRLLGGEGEEEGRKLQKVRHQERISPMAKLGQLFELLAHLA
jgi:hypothetical protein